MSTYLFEHNWTEERRRLALLEHVFDPGTEAHLGRIPLAEGASCLEIGAGAGSVARWLCERVGPDGWVVATDLDTGFLEQLPEKNLEVRRHDIVADELEEGAFDLVHSRLVLDHLPTREQVVRRLAEAVRPGGWLVAECFDWSSLVAAPACSGGDLMSRVISALPLVFPPGAPECGRGVPGMFRAAGLTDVGAEGQVHVGIGGTPAAAFWQVTLAALREPVLGTGALTAAEFDAAAASCDDEGLCFLFPTLVTTWGRRPLE